MAINLHFETDETIKLQTLLKFLQGLHVKYLSYGFSIQKKIPDFLAFLESRNFCYHFRHNFVPGQVERNYGENGGK